MKPDIIRLIAPLPPKGNVAAHHAGQVIFHLDAAGSDVRPATTHSPAYSLDQLKFAPKAAYMADKNRLLQENAALVLYPEGLAFSQISQETRWHRWLERTRRLGLVWALLRHAPRSMVVFRPRLLKKPDHLAIVALALAAKLRHPKRITLARQKTPAEVLVAPWLGHMPAPVAPETAEIASLDLAIKHGSKEGVKLTPVWFNAAFQRLPAHDPLFAEIKTLTEIIAFFQEQALPVLNAPSGYITAAPFEDHAVPPVHGITLTAFMMHIHQARRLGARFPLTGKGSTLAYKNWFLEHAPSAYQHALFRGDAEKITAALTPKAIAAALARIIANARFFGAETGVSPALAAWLNTPVAAGLTRLQILVAVLAHAPVESVQSLKAPWQAQELGAWYARLGAGSYPLLTALADILPPQCQAEWLTTGEGTVDTGLGQNQRMSEACLTGIKAKRRFCLHHVNADAIPAQMLRTHTVGTTHIGFLLWELESLPKAHQLAGEVLDEIWAPTRFVQRIYQQAVDIPVTWIGKGFDLPPAESFDLSRLGLRRGQPFFLLSFDMHSSVARKNPLAAVLAFQMAFEGNPDVRLVIKTSEPPKSHWGDPERQMSIIKKLMARDKRIILFQAHLPFGQYLGLIAAATALVSPHRAEGFGYVPAYAMALGTPVITTDYSGTQDFCTPATALPVPWRKRVVRKGEPIYPLENAFWAEIDHEALAAAMQDVFANPEAASARATAGKTLILGTYSLAAQRKRYIKRLSALGLA